MNDEAPFKLDAADRQSLTWRKLSAHIEQSLHKLRAKNDNDLDPISTANVRGRIAGLKNLLALGESPAPAPETDADE
jgi:hypothetical protein